MAIVYHIFKSIPKTLRQTKKKKTKLKHKRLCRKYPFVYHMNAYRKSKIDKSKLKTTANSFVVISKIERSTNTKINENETAHLVFFFFVYHWSVIHDFNGEKKNIDKFKMWTNKSKIHFYRIFVDIFSTRRQIEKNPLKFFRICL